MLGRSCGLVTPDAGAVARRSTRRDVGPGRRRRRRSGRGPRTIRPGGAARVGGRPRPLVGRAAWRPCSTPAVDRGRSTDPPRHRATRRRGAPDRRQGNRRRRERRVHPRHRPVRPSRGRAGRGVVRHSRRLLRRRRRRDRRRRAGRTGRRLRPRRGRLGEAGRRLAPQGPRRGAQLHRGRAGRCRRSGAPSRAAGGGAHLRPGGSRDGGAGRGRLDRARTVPDRGRRRHAGRAAGRMGPDHRRHGGPGQPTRPRVVGWTADR